MRPYILILEATPPLHNPESGSVTREFSVLLTLNSPTGKFVARVLQHAHQTCRREEPEPSQPQTEAIRAKNEDRLLNMQVSHMLQLKYVAS
jgi:hypothetical protein